MAANQKVSIVPLFLGASGLEYPFPYRAFRCGPATWSCPHFWLKAANAMRRLLSSREKGARMQLAKQRDQLIERRLAVNQLTFLFVAIRPKRFTLDWKIEAP